MGFIMCLNQHTYFYHFIDWKPASPSSQCILCDVKVLLCCSGIQSFVTAMLIVPLVFWIYYLYICCALQRIYFLETYFEIFLIFFVHFWSSFAFFNLVQLYCTIDPIGCNNVFTVVVRTNRNIVLTFLLPRMFIMWVSHS